MPPNDPAHDKWAETWRIADRRGIKTELYAVLEAERRRLDKKTDDGDRTFEAPVSRDDCIHGLFFEGVFDRALEAAITGPQEVTDDNDYRLSPGTENPPL